MICIVVVESHQHVLEHIHGKLRKCLRAKDTRDKYRHFHLIHFDSHPDMACPGPHIPAVACFEPRRTWSTKQTHLNNATSEISVSGGTEIERGDTNSINNRKRCLFFESDDGENLYELLDSTSSGIAEWILPLVLGAGLKKIYWIRSSWSDQFIDGVYSFNVGAVCNDIVKYKTSCPNLEIKDSLTTELLPQPNKASQVKSISDLPIDAVVKVDLPHKYYIEDQSVVSHLDLCLPTQVKFVVSLIDQLSTATKFPLRFFDTNLMNVEKTKQQSQVSHSTNNEKKISNLKKQLPKKRKKSSLADIHEVKGSSHTFEVPWILDICLDYFVCLNPFLSDLKSISVEFTDSLIEIATNLRFYTSSQPHETNDECSLAKVENDIIQFFQNMELLLLSFMQADDSKLSENFGHLEYQTLIHLFTTPNIGQKLIEDLKKNFEIIKNNLTHEESNKLIRLAMDALRNITMPHDENSVDEVSARKKVKEMGKFLRQWKDQASLEQDKDSCLPFCKNNPMMITIARSTLDGFIPQSLVEIVQNAVLCELHSIYCGCDVTSFHSPSRKDTNCKCRIVFDYGHWEGSTCD